MRRFLRWLTRREEIEGCEVVLVVPDEEPVAEEEGVEVLRPITPERWRQMRRLSLELGYRSPYHAHRAWLYDTRQPIPDVHAVHCIAWMEEIHGRVRDRRRAQGQTNRR